MDNDDSNDYKDDNRSNKKKLIAIFMIFILFSSVIALIFNGYGDSENRAPEFKLTDLDGNRFSLSDHRGKVVILDLMATWCTPCIIEMAHLNETFNNYTEDEVVIISIDIDPTETAEQIRTFKEEYGGNWTFASDTDGIEEKYGAEFIPKLVIIDKNGKITYEKIGITTTEVLMIEIEKNL